jgi:hypothetical protein
VTSPFLAPERDDAAKPGRTKGAAGALFYQVPGQSITGAGTAVLTLATDYMTPFVVDTPIVVDQMACEVTSGASGNLRMGLYRADADLQPVGPVMADSGDIAITVAVKTYTPATPLYLARGRYLSVLAMDTGATYRLYRGSWNVSMDTTLSTNPFFRYIYNGRAYAAFTSPGGQWSNSEYAITTNAGWENFIVYRVTAP